MNAPRPGTGERPLTIRVDERSAAAVVTLCGSCTMDQAATLDARLIDLVGRSISLLVIDLHDLDFIESTGLGAIISAYLRLRQRHGSVRFVSPAPPISEILTLTRLTQLFPIHATVEAALAAPPD